jgi:hypothetical protein
LSPVEVVDEAAEVRDFDQARVPIDADGRLDVDLLADHMRGAPAVTGSILTTTDGTRAVLQSGVSTVVRGPAQRAAILLLQLVQANEKRDKEEI